MKKYKFILTLPYEVEIDSAEEIEGHRVDPSCSQGEPYELKGVFDSYEEAEKVASEFKVYKVIITYHSEDYIEEEDSYESEEPIYFFEPDDAEDFLANQIDDYQYGDIYYNEGEEVYEKDDSDKFDDEDEHITKISFKFDTVEIQSIRIEEFDEIK